jgi:RNA polymerase sigma-70 factor (ECF subfamily)
MDASNECLQWAKRKFSERAKSALSKASKRHRGRRVLWFQSVRSDDELMAAYQAGETAAFDELFRRYALPLLRALRRRLGAEDASDVVQQTFLQLHRCRFDYQPGAGIRPWIYTIAFNLQRRQARRGHSQDAFIEEETAIGDGVTWPADGVAIHSVRSAVERLPREQQRVIALHWFEGLPFDQVATTVGASLSAVKVRAHRGYIALRQIFERDDEDV